MKKSLILSIVMTLVLVISMSTATFAWYTANNTVTATVSTITAATASGDLQVAMSDGTGSSYSVTRTLSGTVNPIAPTAELTTGNIATASNWKGYNLDKDSTATVSAAAYSNDVVTGTITLSNASTTATGAISVAVNTTGDNSSKVEIVLVYDDTIVYLSDYGYGATADANTKATADNTLNTTLTTIAGNGSVTLNYYIWLDGFALTNTDMGKVANVEFTFTAAA